MFGTVSDEREISVPASEAWKLYGSLQLSKFVAESFPVWQAKSTLFKGTAASEPSSRSFMLQLQFIGWIGRERLKSYKEKFTVVDDEKRVKVAEVVEGGYLDYFKIM
ncbi:hypothetical protein DH2020_047743 [Rehmannia glutinosa]|uniref:Uncharacterized protein n=1 Tax=Rehmannia glutinosa TaxID=99300 RepID=A0ABR0U7N6_REHGL